MSNRIRGIGAPGKIRPAGTIYEDGQTGILYVQNQSPSGNNWTPLDTNYLDDSTGGSSSFSGGTVQNATNFLSTISSGGTNLYSIFSRIGHTHPISDINNLQGELDSKAPLDSPNFTGNVTMGIGEGGNLEVEGNISGRTFYANTKMLTKGIAVNVINITEASTYDVLETDCAFFILNTSTIRLPSNPDNGRILYFKMSSTGGRTLTIDGNGKNIEGSSTNSMNTARESKTLIYNINQNEWMII